MRRLVPPLTAILVVVFYVEVLAQHPEPGVTMAAGLTPEEAAKRMTVPAGFRVKLAASEPQVHQPIAFTFDHRGRIWLAEAYTYPIRAPEGQGRDKIIIFEDTDGDGTLDQRKVFIAGLNLVSGLEVGFGGVWVGAAPYLLFIADRDGDDRPDGQPEVLLDGFGYHDTHETLNAFIWGPDGWLYGCHGVFTHSRVGKPGTPDAQRTPMNAAVWRYHPRRHRFEVFAYGTSNPWGIDFNDYGQAFMTACVIPHLWHVVQGARYHRQSGQHFNPYVYDDIKTIADHVHYAGNIGDHAWWGHEPVTPRSTLEAGGGHAHCGAMVYLADNWPDEYRNHIFMNNIHGNRVNSDLLERRGSGFVGRHGKDLLLANDRWFRGIQLKYGPDGSVYLIDWYDPNACHRTNPEIWDRTNGRIYNLAYGSAEPLKVDLSRLGDQELAELQLHKNDWYVRMARRLLQERAAAGRLNGDAVGKALWKIVRAHPEVTRRLRAIWALHVAGQLSARDLRDLMDDRQETIRAWAIQLDLEDRQASRSALDRLVDMARHDPSPVVRLYVASALQRLPLEDRWRVAEALAGHPEDAADHNLPLLTWYGIEPLVVADPSRAMALCRASKIELLSRYIARRTAAENSTLPVVFEALAETDDVGMERLLIDEVLQAFEGRVNIPRPKEWTPAYEKLSSSADEAVRHGADQVAVALGDRRIFPRMREVLVDVDAPMAERQRALEILTRGRDADAAEAFQAVLSEPLLRARAIRALAGYDDPKTPAVLVDGYAKLGQREKRDAIATLTSRPAYAFALLAAVEGQKVPHNDLHAYDIRQLLRFKEPELNRRIEEVWGEARETSSDKKERIAQLKGELTAERLAAADLSNGRRLFEQTCASCHALFGAGGNVGPELTGSNRANLDYILENLIDPSAVLGKDYRMTVLVTSDGRVVSGLLQKETDSALTLRTLDDTVVVPKDDIERRELANISVMPDQQLDTLKADEVRDLIAYLASPSQVPLRGPPAPIDPGTQLVPGALEGEAIKVLAKTAGNARSQRMDGFKADRWSGAEQLWWTGAEPGDRLELELEVEATRSYDVEIVLTRARDYGVVELSLDGEALGNAIDLYNFPQVITTGVFTFSGRHLSAGVHKLAVKIVGAHPKAIKAYMFGLDYVRLVAAAAARGDVFQK